jgi:alpha-ketoglutarate-dependent 2,4-dichlorophenoxyacetate dioxygenase
MDVTALAPGFGADVRGLGLADVVSRDDACAEVRGLFEAHSVLLFRDQVITDALQVAFSRRFGPLETATPASLGEGTPFTILTNIDPVSSRHSLARG